MRFYLVALFDAVFSLPWRQPTPDEVIRAEAEGLSWPTRTVPLHPAKMRMRFGEAKPNTDLPHRRGIH